MATPTPCRFCGLNFMRCVRDTLGLCNNCALTEKKLSKKKESQVESINFLVTCPKEFYAKLEEICLSEGKTISEYILDRVKINCDLKTETEIESPQEEEQKEKPKRGRKWS